MSTSIPNLSMYAAPVTTTTNTIPHNNTLSTGDPRPEHHVHKASEPLPGARGGAPAVDYNAETMERVPSSMWDDAEGGAMKPTREASALNTHTQRPGMGERQSSTADLDAKTGAGSGVGPGRTAFSEERVDTQSHSGGATGVATIDGAHGYDNIDKGDMPVGKANAADKLIGKAQQVVGKVAHKPAMQEKGEMREAGGKAAVSGDV
ncbi:hypothetical protein B0H11DRAFT_1213144 [Mycena galericulata]|nr:hypothetical protein B0H11DRAFT_1213144 [Mycena galericulata]